MKLSDASSSTPYKDNTRYIARIELPLSIDGVKRIQKCVRAYTRDAYSRVLVAPTRCMGVIHRRGSTDNLLSDVNLETNSISTSTQEMKVSKIKSQEGDVILFSLLPGGSLTMRSFYRSSVVDWADGLVVEEVEWGSWIALAISARLPVSTGN